MLAEYRLFQSREYLGVGKQKPQRNPQKKKNIS